MRISDLAAAPGYTSKGSTRGGCDPIWARDSPDFAGAVPLDGTGLRHAAAHESRSNQSPEQGDQIADLIRDLLSAGAVFTDADGIKRSVDQSDVLIVARTTRRSVAHRQALHRAASAP